MVISKPSNDRTITIKTEGDFYIIHDELTDVTTQAYSLPEALIMLADALNGFYNIQSTDELLENSQNILNPEKDTDL